MVENLLIPEYKSLSVELRYEDSSEYIKGAEFEVNGYIINFSFLNISVLQFSENKQNSYSDLCTECSGAQTKIIYQITILAKITSQVIV